MRLIAVFIALILLIIPVAAEEEELFWWAIEEKPPELTDTGYVLHKNEVVICKLRMPKPDIWQSNDVYGGGVGMFTHGQDIRIYTIADKDWFVTTPKLKVYSNGKLITQAEFSDEVYDKIFQVYLAYLKDGTIKIAYRYSGMTNWQFLYSEVAGANELMIRGLNAFDFEVQKLEQEHNENPKIPYHNNDPFPDTQPFPDVTTEDDKERQKINVALVGLGGLALAILALTLLRRRG